MGYYTAWTQAAYPPSKVDFSAMSHVAHFSIAPNADGSLNTSFVGTLDPTVPSLAHASGCKALITVGGWGTDVAFRSALGNRAVLIYNLVKYVRDHGYDGIDIDFEPMLPTDGPAFVAFIRDLRAALGSTGPVRQYLAGRGETAASVASLFGVSAAALLAANGSVVPGQILQIPAAAGALLTIAAGDQYQIYAQVADSVDAINLMTYDLCGTWPGFDTWFNSPLFDGGARFKSGAVPPSCDTLVKAALAAGIPRAKLGIGSDWMTHAFTGATGPLQPTQGVTLRDISNADLLELGGVARYDAGTQQAYLVLPSQFIPYDSEATVKAKLAYVQAQGLNGLIVWNIAGGYRPKQPVPDSMLQALK